MKIAIFTDIYAPWGNGGIASSVKAQKEGLEKCGHKVTVFCPGFESHDKSVVTVPTHSWWKVSDSSLAKRPSVVEQFVLEKVPNFAEFDLVHVHYEASCSIAGVRLAKRFDVPLVQTMHGREDMAIAVNVGHPWKWVTAMTLCTAHSKCLKHEMKVKRDKFQAPSWTRAKMWELIVNHAEQADVVVTPSDHFARKIEHYGVTRPIEIVSNGIPEELVELEMEPREMHDGDVLKMVWNSRASKEKRLMQFLQAVRTLKRPYVLHVYGDGNMLGQAKRYAKRYGLKVKFYGAVKRQKIIDRMKEAHLGVLASYNFDVQPMTLLEAQAVGLPVFFCDPTMLEVVPEGGFVIAGGPEAAAMAIALENLAPEKINAMSKKMLARRRDVRQEAQIRDLVKVYKKAQEEHQKRKTAARK